MKGIDVMGIKQWNMCFTKNMSNTNKIKNRIHILYQIQNHLAFVTSWKSEFSKTIEKRGIELDVRASVSYKVDMINFIHVYFDELDEYIVQEECFRIK